MGAVTGGVDKTRAFWMFAVVPAGGVAAGGTGLPTEAMAFAIPMNVVGDNMTNTLWHKR